jgi:tetratricopeptide (TPR) repeat protein
MFLLSCLGVLATSCAANVTSPRDVGSFGGHQDQPGVTSLQAPGDSRLSPEARAPAPIVDRRTSDAVEALCARDYQRVLALSESPSSAPTAAWLDYDRAAAFTGLARTDEAVETFRRAELRFGEENDLLGTSVAIWGRARALDEAGRCDEARRAYAQYEALERMRDPRAAEMAAAYSGACKPITILR